MSKARELTKYEKERIKTMIDKLNKIIVAHHGENFVESERDDLCNIRWVLENKLNGNITFEEETK